MLMWVLLPPIFIVCMLIALAAPFLVQKSVAPSAENDTAPTWRQLVGFDRNILSIGRSLCSSGKIRRENHKLVVCE